MTDWRDKLQPASFRGVPFLVESSDMSFGRRAFRAEFPYRDKPFVDDMGKRARDYSVDAFLLEAPDSDLFKQRSALIDALEKAGPGTLVHPRLGALRVQVGSVRWRPAPRKNVEHFSIDFMDAASDAQPSTALDTLDKLRTAADAATGAQQSMFERALNVSRQASFVIDAARDAVNTGLTGVRRWVSLGTQVSDSLSQLTLSIDSTIGAVGDLLLMPRTLAGTVCTLVRQVMALPDNVKSIMGGYRNLSSMWGDAEPIPQTTPSRVMQAQNQTAIAQLFATAATIEATRAVCELASGVGVTSNAQSPFASANEAYAVRDELMRALEQIASTADDTLYNATVALQSALSAHISAHGNTLPRVETVTYHNSLPALVIAHLLDGNIEREADLTRRNRIRHPLFVVAGTELEVLRGR